MFTNKDSFKQLFQENLISKLGKPMKEAQNEDIYKILSNMIREYVGKNWAQTNERYKENQEKQVYYFSMEFLIGRLLGNNLLNLDVLELVREGLQELGWDLEDIEEEEVDAGLGNGGLGRLAACFLDSLASLQYPGHGCGIRYKYGLFEQKIIDGNQVELPDFWLQKGNEWEVRRDDKKVEVRFWGNVEVIKKDGEFIFETRNYESVTAVPYDVPVIGYGGEHINTLRLWSAESTMDLTKLSRTHNYYNSLNYKRSVESISEFLYPDDTLYEGKLLRLKQQYFLCSAGLQSILRTFGKLGLTMDQLPTKVAIHINDTHPTLVIPELMRILIDEKEMTWEQAWEVTTRTVSYTNHTTLSEALEKWSVSMVRQLLPRIYMIIEEINTRFCGILMSEYPEQPEIIPQMSIIDGQQLKMANLAIVGSYSVNGVAALHTEILIKREMKLFYDLYPNRFNNKTNGITHRRWLLHANPALAKLISDAIGTRWIDHPQEMLGIMKYSEDSGFQDRTRAIKQHNKMKIASYVLEKQGIIIDPYSIFDVHVKRLHGYKRQLMNILHIMHLYNEMKANPSLDRIPRTFIFGAKAAPSYSLAKRVIKLIHVVADQVNRDKDVNEKLKVVFLENYSVSLAEKIIPSADVSEQISTASKEASGTGNMKFMMNGALTLGTLDGANVEMHNMIGEDNMFLFGLQSDEILHYYQYGGYVAEDVYRNDPRVREVLEQLVKPSDFCHHGHVFDDLFHSIMSTNDEYFVLKDFASYADAHLRVDLSYRNTKEWQQKSIMNIAHSGKFSSDCTITKYATEIWRLQRKQAELHAK
ncbi:glycogen/starch/alpha-glucan phosphorylase [Paenibacillus crassostreae]|uniref:Alpha-1,4 glucan phosphorylase n=1 Tax=Paenibacillus crassostreae TaxID=1763538 RepID=A0A167FRE3_9BACL|nr:glycogen/starch/alpha-glucan phosphorylase [Paenibacillus crassostreae]AOZ94139.1 glycogen phosphorylase [Paenibacillus crassostreae]OAB76825.1 glycogen phosphorylase [Paenibacillus crassostreae]